MSNKKIPASVVNDFIHVKNTDETESVVLPYTRYDNILNAPKVVSTPTNTRGANFLLYKTGEEELTISEIRKLINNLL